MPIHTPCPRCQTPLEIPQPVPDQIRCEKCGAVIKKKVGPAEKQEAVTANPPSAPIPIAAHAPPELQQQIPSASRLKVMVLAGLLGGGLLVCVLPIAGLGLAWVLSGNGVEKRQEDEPLAQQVPKVEIENAKKIQRPPDPRIKIVQPAVDKGVAYLKANVDQIANQRAAYAGLNGLALLECGVNPDDPVILKMAEIIRTAAPTMSPIYDLSSSLFFLNSLNESRPLDEKDRKMARSFALRIIAGQESTGPWHYAGVVLTPEEEAKLLISLQDGTYKPTRGPSTSLSNTQFAMLAVWGARKHGVPVRDPLLATAGYFHANQHPDGHWVYPGFGLTASSTCAGLIGLAIETALREDKEFTSKHPIPAP